jgi:hypothetical protein
LKVPLPRTNCSKEEELRPKAEEPDRREAAGRFGQRLLNEHICDVDDTISRKKCRFMLQTLQRLDN